MSWNIKLLFSLVVLAVASTLVGCHTTQTPITQSLVTGTYTYVSNDPETRVTDHNLSRLILQSDGTYDLVEGGTTKARSEKKGGWKVVSASTYGSEQLPNVELDKAGYPIEVTKREIRLLIDQDTGVWWAKPR